MPQTVTTMLSSRQSTSRGSPACQYRSSTRQPGVTCHRRQSPRRYVHAQVGKMRASKGCMRHRRQLAFKAYARPRLPTRPDFSGGRPEPAILKGRVTGLGMRLRHVARGQLCAEITGQIRQQKERGKSPPKARTRLGRPRDLWWATFRGWCCPRFDKIFAADM